MTVSEMQTTERVGGQQWVVKTVAAVSYKTGSNGRMVVHYGFNSMLQYLAYSLSASVFYLLINTTILDLTIS
jgi:hypothetical protein